MSNYIKLIQSIKDENKSARLKVSDSYLELIKLYPLKTIETKKDYKLALSITEKIMTFHTTTRKQDKGIKIYLKTLSNLISNYEESNFKSQAIKGKDMLAYLMKLQGLTQSDLKKEVGSLPIISKILKGEKELNLRQIKALAKRFKVSPEVFI